MRAEIISVGTELLLGEILDTNSQYLAQQLTPLGIDLFFVTHVGDNLGRLTDTVQRALKRSDILVMTGGLGPTEDDLTREAVATALGEKMEVVPELERHLREWFRRRNRPMPERNVKQATLIPSAQAVPNPIGTAPGWWVETGGKNIACMPGVPHEMRKMWEEQIVPRLAEKAGGRVLVTRTLKTIGMGEGGVEELLQPLIRSANPTLATYAKQDGVHVRMGAKAETRDAAVRMLDDFELEVRRYVGEYIYGVDEHALPDVIGELLRKQGLTLATMESCTGGLLASSVTDAAGSSEYFRGGIVAYTADVKIANGVAPELIERSGTVSVETAAAMAVAARLQLGADIGLSTTGVAGPGEMEGKPAGTLHVAMDFLGQIRTDSSIYSTTRPQLKRRAVLDVLYLLWRELKEREAAAGAERRAVGAG
jgi:nicotinamide-nucleotide amidase